MCLYVSDPNQKKPIRTRDEIFVYKVIYHDNTSIHRFFHYVPNKLYELPPRDDGSFLAIFGARKKLEIIPKGVVHEGFHAYTTFNKADAMRRNGGPIKFKVVKFRIPPYSKIVYGTGEEIVSDQIESGNLVPL